MIDEAKDLLQPGSIRDLVEQATNSEIVVEPGSVEIVPPHEAEHRFESSPIVLPTNSSDKDTSGMVKFTLGAVYSEVCMNQSIVDLFTQSDANLKFDYVALAVDYYVLPSVVGWENTIEHMSADTWPAFCKFLSECGFYKKSDANKVWSLYCKEVTLLDPATCIANLVNVITPQCPKYTLVPVVTNGIIRFTRVPGVLDNRFQSIIDKI